jgi:hypothetical protein
MTPRHQRGEAARDYPPAEAAPDYPPAEAARDYPPAEAAPDYPPAEAGPDYQPGEAGPDYQPAEAGLAYQPGEAGVVALPSGRLVRGRGLRHAMPSGHPPTFGVYLLGGPPPEFGWTSRWVRWPDFRLPADPAELRSVLAELLERAGSERAEIACGGGRGRTGTALACLAVLDGVPAVEAVAWVREHYHPGAVETPWQRRYVRNFR